MRRFFQIGSQCLIDLGIVLCLYSGQVVAQAGEVIPVSGDTKYVHDPSIIKEGDTWYLFGTASGPSRDGELPIRCSKDLHEWKKCGNVFNHIPEWIEKESPKTKELWAPDISYFNGEYHLYYAFSVFGKNTSGIALLTNKTLNSKSPDFRWVDHGLILQSRVEDDFNAIDPNIVLDHGQPWLSFGSFWTGIKMRKIDAKTGLVASDDNKLYSLAQRQRPPNPPPNPPGLPGDWQAIEAPFIVQHGDYFYLFVSFDLCCRGTKSSYKTMVGRSNGYIESQTGWCGGCSARHISAKLSRPEGDVYVSLHVEQDNDTTPAWAEIVIVEMKPMDSGLVMVNADSLASDISRTGHASVYGISFDTGKADVKPESVGTLEEIAKLLQKSAQLKLYVVGHTDNVGNLASNQDLSQRRADAVAQLLSAKYGVLAARLRAIGDGPSAPVASNDSEEGRAKNRRVELVKQ